MVVRGCDAPHLVPTDVSSDVFVECGDFAVRPVFVKDVEPQRGALDDEVVESRHCVRVVTGAAHHAAEFAADFLDDEELFGRTDTESKPNPDHVLLR